MMSEALTLRIEKPVYGGAGLARHQGQVIFTPFALPGELVTANVTSTKASFAEARLASVIESAPERVAARCPYFAVCGGCHYQHANYEAQLAMKRSILAETLTRAKLTALPEIITHTGQPFGYRNRIRLHLDPGTSALGYRERGSHRLLAVDVCPIAAPELERALQALSPLCTQQQCGRVFGEVELSSNQDGSELLLALWLRSAAVQSESHARLTQLCEVLRLAVPSLRGGCVHAPPSLQEHSTQASNRNRHVQRAAGGAGKRRPDKSGSVDVDREDQVLEEMVAGWGATSMIYKAANMDYRVSLGAFFQVNRTLVDELVTLATAGRSGALAWDLYAGVGLFSCALARKFEQVVAVEAAPISAKDLAANLGAPHQAVRAGTSEFLRRQLAERDLANRKSLRRDTRTSGTLPRRPEFVLVDPPRAGLGVEAARMLSEIGPAAITYVSCDPATLARDLRAFVELGYKLEQLHLIDLFPQTFHLEAVTMLSLG